MATVKISALPASGALTGAEAVPVVQTGTTVRTTTQDIANLTQAAVDTVSARVDTVSQQISVLSQQVSALSQNVSVLSQGLSVVSQALSNETSNRISADNALSNSVSVVSNALSNEISNRISAVNALSQSISVLSQGLSVVSNALSNEISNRVSADNALSNSISVVSNALSNEISNRTSAVNALSNAISVVSNALSNEISNRISADNALSAKIDTISQQVSVLSQAMSVLSAGLGTVQMKVVTNVQGVSATTAAGIKISGLSISVAASGVYQMEAFLLFSTSGTANFFGFGMSTSGATFGAVGGQWNVGVSITNNTLASTAVVMGNFNTIGAGQVCALAGTTGAAIFAMMNGVAVISTSGGTVRLKARTSVSSFTLNIMKGCYFRAYKIG